MSLLPAQLGKSALAREIAFRTGSIYVDLAKADPVGANTLTGGLARSGFYTTWEEGCITALIDGLDEAALKATREGLEAFLSDIVELSAMRDVPIVLFGRTAAIEDAWITLVDKCSVAVLEIGYYDRDSSIAFAETQLIASHPDRSHPSVDRQALTLLLDNLRSQTGKRWRSFCRVCASAAGCG